VAQAPVPHASVMPQPRSHTPSSSSVAGRASARELGVGPARERGVVLEGGPDRPGQRCGRSPGSSTNTMACGLPIDTAVTARRRPSPGMVSGPSIQRSSAGPVAGSRPRVRRGRPMSTVTGVDGVGAQVPQHAGGPAPVSITRRSPSAASRSRRNLRDAADAVAAHLGLAAVGVEDPHGRDRAGGRGADSASTPSPPTPNWRSHSQRTVAGSAARGGSGQRADRR
jgi:hypothetical protein